MKKNILISLLLGIIGVITLGGCKKNNSCDACKEYKFIYYPDASWAGHLHGNRSNGNFFNGTVMKRNVPNSLKKHPYDTIEICAEIKIQYPDVDNDELYNVTKFNCIKF